MRDRLLGLGVLAVLAVVTVVAARQVTGLRSQYDIEQFYPSGDPEVALYRAFRADFGLSDTTVLLILTGADVFDPGAVRSLRRITRTLSSLEGVEEVYSLTNATLVRAGTERSTTAAGADGSVTVEEPLGADYRGAGSLSDVRRRMLAEPLLRDHLVARDARSTCVLLRLARRVEPQRAWQLEQAIRDTLALETHPFKVLLGGAPLVRARYVRLIRGDLGTYLPLAVALFVVVLLSIYRGPVGVLLPLAAVALAALWTLGGYAALGGTLDLLTSLVPVILLIVGLADAIHLLSHYRNHSARPEGGSPLSRTLKEVGPACLMTTLTTVVGFSVLALSEMKAVRTFGLVTAAGVAAAFVATILFLPAALTLLPAPRPPRRPRRPSALDRALGGVAGLCRRRPGRVLVASGIVVALAVLGIIRLDREIRLYGNLPDDHPYLAAERFADRQLGGALSIELLLDTGRPDGARAPAAVAELMRLERWLRGRRDVRGVRSMLDPLRAVHAAVSGKRARELPPRQDLIGQYLVVLSMAQHDPTRPYLSFSGRRARISVRINDMGQQATLGLVRAIRRQAAEAAPGITVQVTGYAPILHRVYREVVDGMALSFGLAFLVIVVLIALLFRSPRLSLVSLVPNVLPMLAALGFIGWCGIPLSPTASLVFAVAFGIAVDDTIHFVTQYRFRRREGLAAGDAVERAVRLAGRPIVHTSLVLVAGFSVFVTSSFRGNLYFGLITAVTLVAALLADLLVLPALLVLVDGER